MAKRPQHVGTTPRSTRKPAALPRRGAPILRPADLRTILIDLANQLAPADVSDFIKQEDQLRAGAARLTRPDLAVFRKQFDLALTVLRDHAEGNCPQIPYYTIAMLAAAVYYFTDELDVIPDFLPRVGRLDDAAVMAMAFRLADAGLRRYLTWKGRAPDSVLDSRNSRRGRRLPAS
jgi:uncharacterized membrane protein YkvA (DUF1232 family)